MLCLTQSPADSLHSLASVAGYKIQEKLEHSAAPRELGTYLSQRQALIISQFPIYQMRPSRCTTRFA